MHEYCTSAWLLRTRSSKLKACVILCQNSWARTRRSTTNSELIRSPVTTWIRKKSDFIIVYYIWHQATITGFIRLQIGLSNLLVTSLVRIRNKMSLQKSQMVLISLLLLINTILGHLFSVSSIAVRLIKNLFVLNEVSCAI